MKMAVGLLLRRKKGKKPRGQGHGKVFGNQTVRSLAGEV